MKYLCAGILGICFFVLFLSCSESSNGVTVKTLIALDPVTYYDTIAVDTSSSGVDSTGTKDTVLYDTVTTIEPKTDSISWIMVTVTKKYDTTYITQTVVETLTIQHDIYEKVIYDTLSSSGDTLSDTVTADTMGTFNIVNVNNAVGGTVIDTILDSAVIAVDTHFVTTYLIATTSDGVKGNVGVAAMDWLTLDTVYSGSTELFPIHYTNSVYAYNHSAYIFNNDSILTLSTLNISDNANDSTVSVDADLYDISFVNENKAYITQNTNSGLVVYNPSNYTTTTFIDISPYAGVATPELPYMQSSMVYNGKLYILCQRLKSVQNSKPVPDSLPGTLVILAVDDDSFIDSIPLTKKNPVSMDVMNGFLYVSSAGFEDSTDGGIEKIDLSLDSLIGLVLPETDTTIQNFGDIVLVSSTKGYIKATSPVDNRTDLFEFNPSTGAVGERVFVLDNPTGDVIYDGRYLYVADRSLTNPGVVVVNPVNNSVVAGPIKMGALPPSSLAIMTVSKR